MYKDGRGRVSASCTKMKPKIPWIRVPPSFALHDLFCNQPPEGDRDVLASLSGSGHAVHLYIQSMGGTKRQRSPVQAYDQATAATYSVL